MLASVSVTEPCALNTSPEEVGFSLFWIYGVRFFPGLWKSSQSPKFLVAAILDHALQFVTSSNRAAGGADCSYAIFAAYLGMNCNFICSGNQRENSVPSSASHQGLVQG